MERNIVSCLEYLSKQKDYVVISQNAVFLNMRWLNDICLPFEILTTNKLSCRGIILVEESPLESLSKKAIMKESQRLKIRLENHNYIITVAKPEHLVALDLAVGKHYGRDAFKLIQHSDIDFEEVRAILKSQPNYDQLYTTLTQAHYELTNV